MKVVDRTRIIRHNGDMRTETAKKGHLMATTNITKRSVQQRLDTILGKLDHLISDVSGTGVLTDSQRKDLRMAFNLMMPVESKLYHEEGATK